MCKEGEEDGILVSVMALMILVTSFDIQETNINEMGSPSQITITTPSPHDHHHLHPQSHSGGNRTEAVEPTMATRGQVWTTAVFQRTNYLSIYLPDL